MIAGLCLFAPVSPIHAQTTGTNTPPPTPADSPCDPNYYESLKARAWLEAQREITSNQNLIYKPDSVLQYTCFERFNSEVAMAAETMFSETRRWGVILPNTSMDTALSNLVGSAMTSYLLTNFGDGSDLFSMLGGRSTGITFQQESINGNNGSYECDMMMRVWLEAKCRDFTHNANDWFYPFEDYARQGARDRRYLPIACGSISDRWRQNIGLAYVDTVPPNAPPGSPTTSTPWTEDSVLTHLEAMNPANCEATNPQLVFPIETGIIVTRPGATPATYNERVCIPPGCHYNPQTRRCVRP